MTAHAEFLERRTFANLDGLRCLSILAVLWYHMPIQWAEPLPAWMRRGFLGVDLFFVVSGFLITTLLLRERARRGRISLGAFYARRSLRIFPLYYAVLGGMWIWIANDSFIRGTGADGPFAAKLPFYATYTSNLTLHEIIFSPAWSLATEEQFYLLWPPVLALALPWMRWTVLVAVLGVSIGTNWGLLDGLALHPAFKTVGFAPIALGVLLAHALHHTRSFGVARRVLAHPAWVLLPLVALLLCAHAKGPAERLQPGDLRGWARLGVHLAMVWIVAHAVVCEHGPFSWCMRVAPLRWIGRISYGIYLMQIPVLLYITVHLARTQGRIHWLAEEALPLGAAFVAASIAAAACSWFVLERWFLQLKQRFGR